MHNTDEKVSDNGGEYYINGIWNGEIEAVQRKFQPQIFIFYVLKFLFGF